ncbi:YrhC family protein [Bacillus sp. REN16]|uniref:YrhC family protein n=1 Tax=Bacillus sp. REN16 TaxID=2887296 RepID=UPI001E31FBB2|nr:YrhC family protein [Bacillus sp. REN16]MCC3356631.1 YrhC family protein [Bacillus sp. REN16]
MDHNKQLKNLRHKITDFISFGYILLVLSVFFYIGIIIPEERSPFQIYSMMGSTLIFLSSSFTFFLLAIKYKKQLEEE